MTGATVSCVRPVARDGDGSLYRDGGTAGRHRWFARAGAGTGGSPEAANDRPGDCEIGRDGYGPVGQGAGCRRD
ncbi:hypothetical protein GCM10009548_41020 [Streptomyces malaysiensis subsp. malaysiensis]